MQFVRFVLIHTFKTPFSLLVNKQCHSECLIIFHTSRPIRMQYVCDVYDKRVNKFDVSRCRPRRHHAMKTLKLSVYIEISSLNKDICGERQAVSYDK